MNVLVSKEGVRGRKIHIARRRLTPRDKGAEIRMCYQYIPYLLGIIIFGQVNVLVTIMKRQNHVSASIVRAMNTCD